MGAKLKAVGMIGIIQRYDTIQHPLIYEDEYWSVYGELQSFGLQLHAYVHKWSPNSFKFIYAAFINLCVQSKYPIFAVADNKKLRKFCNMLGLVSVDTLFDKDGKIIGELMFVPNTGEKYV